MQTNVTNEMWVWAGVFNGNGNNKQLNVARASMHILLNEWRTFLHL